MLIPLGTFPDSSASTKDGMGINADVTSLAQELLANWE